MTHTRDPAEVERFIERFTQVLVDSGMPRIASRIIISLLATDSARLTAGELAEQLRASPAAISGGVRYLTQLNMVHKGRETGSRRDYYHVDNDVWYQTIAQRDQVMSRWTANLQDGVRALGAGTPAGDRLAESAEFFEFMQKELDHLMERWETYRQSRR